MQQPFPQPAHRPSGKSYFERIKNASMTVTTMGVIKFVAIIAAIIGFIMAAVALSRTEPMYAIFGRSVRGGYANAPVEGDVIVAFTKSTCPHCTTFKKEFNVAGANAPNKFNKVLKDKKLVFSEVSMDGTPVAPKGVDNMALQEYVKTVKTVPHLSIYSKSTSSFEPYVPTNGKRTVDDVVQWLSAKK